MNSQKSIFLILSVLFASVQSAGLIDGECPVYESNKDFTALNMTHFGGLWYEYAYSPEFLDGDDRECATWNLLHHDVNGTAPKSVFDVLLHGTNKTAKTTGFKRNALICGKSKTPESQRCQYWI